MTEDFIQKLMVSKQIMDKHKEIPRSGQGNSGNYTINESSISTPELYSAEPVPANYNIPQEFLSTQPKINTQPVQVTEERIKNSKLPDAIKKLMIEHPIEKPNNYNPTISNEILEKAAKLMGENKTITQSANKVNSESPIKSSNNGDLKKIIKETMEEIMRENGMLVESTSKSQDTFSFKVGKHIFEGKITKIKKVS